MCEGGAGKVGSEVVVGAGDGVELMKVPGARSCLEVVVSAVLISAGRSTIGSRGRGAYPRDPGGQGFRV